MVQPDDPNSFGRLANDGNPLGCLLVLAAVVAVLFIVLNVAFYALCESGTCG